MPIYKVVNIQWMGIEYAYVDVAIFSNENDAKEYNARYNNVYEILFDYVFGSIDEVEGDQEEVEP